MVDSGATNSFVHREVVQYLNITTGAGPAVRVTLANGSYIDCSIPIPLYLKLHRNLQYKSYSRVSETVHVGFHILCYILPNLIIDVVLGMDWLHAINPLVDWNIYSPSLDCRGETICIWGTKYSCSHAFVKVCALKSVLKMMCSDKVSAWFGV